MCARIKSSAFFINDTATTEIYNRSLHDARPIWRTVISHTKIRSLDNLHPWGSYRYPHHEARCISPDKRPKSYLRPQYTLCAKILTFPDLRSKEFAMSFGKCTVRVVVRRLSCRSCNRLPPIGNNGECLSVSHAVFVEFAIQGRSANSQQFGSLLDVVTRFLQRLSN